jgi:hypothetical protein cdiviTM7_00597
MKVLMFIKKQSSSWTGWFKNSVMFLCLLAFFIMPVANILSVNPALAAKNPGRFESLSDEDKYKFFQYATAMSYCFSGKSHKDHGSNLNFKVHRNVDGSLSKGIVFNYGARPTNDPVYIGTMSEAYDGKPIAGYAGGTVHCMNKDFQKEAFKIFQIEPNELLCQMGYKKKGHKDASVEECINLGKNNDFETQDLPAPPGDVNFINALTNLTGYPNNAEEQVPFIKYRKYLDWSMGCVDGDELSTSSNNTRTLSVVKDGKVSEVYRSKGSGDYMWNDGSDGENYEGDPQFKCDTVIAHLKTAAIKYANSLKDAAIKNACSTFTGKELEACKAGIEHKGDSEYCETQYKGRDEEINACKQGQSAEIETPSEGDGGEEEGKNSCGLSAVGWFVCPLMSFAGSLGDASYSAISYFLSIDNEIFKDQENGGLAQAWKFFRDVANAVFAVIFLWVIFSQISNVGVSNYGIKKILPRLIIGALLVNLSFYLCQIAVDLSNILGFSLKEALEGAASKVGTQATATGTFSALVTGGLVLVGVGLFIFLAVSIPTLLALILALIVVLVILIVRQAAVILLIAISPLAFAAWLLPNTENLFKKWVSMFRGLLIVFPVISLLYGAGKLAGTILAVSATDDPNNPKETMQLAALAASILPLGATPFVLKSSLNSLGSFAGKLGGLSGLANKKLGGAIGNSIGNSRLNDLKKGWQKNSARRQANRRSGNTKFGRMADELRGSNSRLARGAGIILNPRRALDNSWLGRATGLSEGAARSQAVSDELFENEVKGQALALRGMTSSEIAAIARTGKTLDGKKEVSRSMYAAAIDHTMSNGGFEDRAKVLSSLEGKDAVIKNRAINAAFAKGDNNILGNRFGDAILEDKIKDMTDLESMAIKNAADGNLQAEHLVQNAAGTDWLVKATINAGSKQTNANYKAAKAAESNIKSSAIKARFNPNTAKNINGKLDDTFRKVGA